MVPPIADSWSTNLAARSYNNNGRNIFLNFENISTFLLDPIKSRAGEGYLDQLELIVENDIYDYHDGHKRQLFSRMTDDLVPQDIVVTKTDRGNSSGFSHCHLSLNAAHLNFLQTRPHCFLS